MLVSSHWTPCVIYISSRQPQLSSRVWNLIGNVLISSSSKRSLNIIVLKSRVNPYNWRSSTSDFIFESEIEITFKRYISLSFSRNHNGIGKKRLKEVLCKHKERKSGLPNQINPLYYQIALFLWKIGNS